MQKIAVYGGSFNPIHNAHIGIAKRFIDEIGLDKVCFVPTNITPLKDNSNVISAFHRIKMCELAVSKHSGMMVSDVEVRRDGISYTSDTLRHFKSVYPDSELYLVMGADMFMTLDKWHNAGYIFNTATILTAPRDIYNYDCLVDKTSDYSIYSCKSYISRTPIQDLSSTYIRECIKNNIDISNYLDCDVVKYIKDNGLYR